MQGGKGRRRRAWSIVSLGALLVAFAALAPGAGAARTSVDTEWGNATKCSTIGLGSSSYFGGIDEDTSSGTKSSADGKFVVQLTMNKYPGYFGDVYGFDFTVTKGIVRSVVVKGGPKYNEYHYSGVTGESDSVTSPWNSLSKKYYEISHAYFCYDPEPDPTTTTTEPPTTTTTEPPTTTTEPPTTTTEPPTTTTTEPPTTTTTEPPTTTTTEPPTTTTEVTVTTLGTTSTTEPPTTTTEPPTTTTEVTVTTLGTTTTVPAYGGGDTTTTVAPTTTTTDSGVGAGGGTTPTTAAAQASGQLPRTGSHTNALAALGLTMILGGMALLGLDRRPARSRS